MTPYWHRYVLEVEPPEIESKPRRIPFEDDELIGFEHDRAAPTVLVSQGSAGHAYVFTELALRIHEKGFNVFIMPKHGGRTIPELVERHRRALRSLASRFSGRIGVFAEGLGGYAAFYLALDHGPMQSLICQNAPAILTEPAFHAAVLGGDAVARRRKRLLPLLRALNKVAPRMPVPVSIYLDFRALVDTKPNNRAIESRIVESYLHDPDFDWRYPLRAVLSLLDTPPPGTLADLVTPTMFLLPERGLAPDYVRDLYRRLPSTVTKKLVEVDGSVFWMVSHPREAASAIATWFDETLSRDTNVRPLDARHV